VHIALATDGAPFAHRDGLAGQTPRSQKVGISALWLYRDASDTAPLVVFDLGAASVLADLGPKRSTAIASVPTRSLIGGHYTYARTWITHVEYEVDTTMHVGGAALAGSIEAAQVFTDGAQWGGAARRAGFFQYQFKMGGSAFGAPLAGDGAPLPTVPAGGGFSLSQEGGRGYYGYPCDVWIDPNVVTDYDVVMTLNVDRNFRWVDQAAPSYAAGTWDTTPASFEPVARFGANAFSLLSQAR
jgi:hypothetical protein